jgi:succinate-semialdehyde dehydrogenase/glutarate-semialdehyde dehydrogenase
MTRTPVLSQVARLLSGVPTDLLIGGEWAAASDGASFPVIDPASGETLTAVSSATVADGLSAADAAEHALPSWRSTAPRERAEILRRAWQLMIERQDDLARLIVVENGKALPDARSEVAYAAEFFRWYAEEAVRADGALQVAPSGSNRIMVSREPIGVSLLITPWNFPAAMATRKIGPALAAGCTMIFKPASDTPLTALAIGALLAEAGVPDGVINVLPSRRSGELAHALLSDCRVRKLSFTGSTEVGRTLLAEAAANIVSCSMELGGNAPFLVLADADIDEAVSGAMVAKMRNGGEACTAANRFYVDAQVAEEFSDKLAGRMSALRMGSGLDHDVELGPLINSDARDKVDELVSSAVDAGARTLTGGKVPSGAGYFYPPTVLSEVPADARILTQEIFGPVAPVVSCGSVPEMIEHANATEYGLVSYVYSGDLAAGLRVADSLETGMVGLNRPVVSDPAAPFGGVKQSGLGREGGHDGLLEFMESKYIAVQW